MIILGLMAVPSIVLSKKPNAKEIFDKVAPYQGWAGCVFLILGLIGLINCLLHVGSLGITPLAWMIWLFTAVVQIALGFILGYGLLRKYILSGHEEAEKSGEKLLTRLLPLQGTLGVIAIVIGILQIVSSIIWF